MSFEAETSLGLERENTKTEAFSDAIREDLLTFAQALVELAQWTATASAPLSTLVSLGLKTYQAKKKVCPTGVGKSFLLAKRISARLRSHGLVSVALHPTEAMHGDLGLLAPGDLVVFLSHSGASVEMHQLAKQLQPFSVKTVGLGARPQDPFGLDAWIPLPPTKECCPLGLAPTTSQLQLQALMDSITNRWVESLNLQRSHFAQTHPSGSLGRQLFREQTQVEQVMHRHAVASPSTSLRDLTLQMTAQKLGGVLVVKDTQLLGLITEADLRKAFASECRWDTEAARIMNPKPVTIHPHETLEEAFALMQEREAPISALPVISLEGEALGLIRLHDCFLGRSCFEVLGENA